MEENMKLFNKLTSALTAFVLLLSALSVPLLADEVTSGYSVSTALTVNNYSLVNNESYGEAKFYVNPTYTFDDSTVLNNGDTLVYSVPSVFKLEQALNQPITAASGEEIAQMVTDPTTGKVTVTITNADYFARLNEGKKLSFLFTVVWNDTTPYNVAQTFTFLGAPEYTLTRIKVDEEPQGYSKWGTQDPSNPNYVNWRIRINRDVKDLGQVVIKDVIPEGQELATEISGYYFENWDNGPKTSFTANDPSIVTITDANNFTINAGDLSNRGIYIVYKTLLTAPVDKVDKKVYNDIVVTSNGTPMEALTYRPFAPLTTTDGVGSGSRSDEVAFTVNKVLDGRTLNADEFTFELVDDATGNVIQTVKNAADGTVTFEKVKFSTVGEFTYTIREVASGLTGVTDDTDSDIKVTVTVVDNGGVKQATTTYDRTAFTNTYVAPTTTTTTTTTSEPTTTAATTTTTVEPTTTVATTTTTAEPTTTAPTTTTTTAGTTVAPATTTKTPTPKKGKTLPKTGEESGLVTALIGFALLAAGLAGVFYRKSKKA
jgi:pilin isopeptide linkage protein/LPXTG-motif cell wall-anchored protein